MSKAKRSAEETYKLLTTPPNPAEGAAYYNAALVKLQEAYIKGYKQAEKDILSIIESRLSEIIGDAQPRPALRAELEELIKRIKQ